MAYIGLNPQLKAYKDAVFQAVGGETVIPIKCDMETLVAKNGSLLIPRVDYYINRNNTISLATAASAGDEYYIIDISTFTFSESVTRTEVEGMLDRYADPLFHVIWWPARQSIPQGFVPADGQELSRGLFVDAFTGIEAGIVPVSSEADWQSDVKWRASYTLGNNSTTFRVPDYNGKSAGAVGAMFFRGDGKGADASGKIQSQSVENHSHTLGGSHTSIWYDSLPSFGDIEFTNTLIPGGNRWITTIPQTPMTINPYGSDETRPVNTSGVWCIRLFNGTVYSGRANAAQLATEVGKLESEVQQLRVKAEMDQWYSGASSEFKARFIGMNTWVFAENSECMFKETDKEIHLVSIIRKVPGLLPDAFLFQINNPEGVQLTSTYCVVQSSLPNLPPQGGVGAVEYIERFDSNESVIKVWIPGLSPTSYDYAWIMFDMKIAKGLRGKQ